MKPLAPVTRILFAFCVTTFLPSPPRQPLICGASKRRVARLYALPMLGQYDDRHTLSCSPALLLIQFPEGFERFGNAFVPHMAISKRGEELRGRKRRVLHS